MAEPSICQKKGTGSGQIGKNGSGFSCYKNTLLRLHLHNTKICLRYFGLFVRFYLFLSNICVRSRSREPSLKTAPAPHMTRKSRLRRLRLQLHSSKMSQQFGLFMRFYMLSTGNVFYIRSRSHKPVANKWLLLHLWQKPTTPAPPSLVFRSVRDHKIEYPGMLIVSLGGQVSFMETSLKVASHEIEIG